MLTGNRAFESFAKNMGGPKHLFGTESGNWSGVPDALRQLIIGMLDTAPEQRTTDVELIRMKLDHVIADSTVDAGQKT